jgi:hypothetical protein
MVRRNVKPELNIRKMLLVGLALLAGALLILGISAWIWFSRSFTSYKNEKIGVAISYPRHWFIQRLPAKDILIGFYAPKEHAMDSFLENVNLSVFDMSKNILSTDKYAKLIIEQMNALFKDLKLVEKSVFPLSGRKGYRMVLSPTSDAPLTMVAYVFTIEDVGYNLLYIGANEQYPKDRFLLDAMALSLKVKY